MHSSKFTVSDDYQQNRKICLIKIIHLGLYERRMHIDAQKSNFVLNFSVFSFIANAEDYKDHLPFVKVLSWLLIYLVFDAQFVSVHETASIAFSDAR
jgi:hypothetical protein